MRAGHWLADRSLQLFRVWSSVLKISRSAIRKPPGLLAGWLCLGGPVLTLPLMNPLLVSFLSGLHYLVLAFNFREEEEESCIVLNLFDCGILN